MHEHTLNREPFPLSQLTVKKKPVHFISRRSPLWRRTVKKKRQKEISNIFILIHKKKKTRPLCRQRMKGKNPDVSLLVNSRMRNSNTDWVLFKMS